MTEEAEIGMREFITSFLIFLIIVLGLINLCYLYKIPLFSSIYGTTLLPGDLLLVAGITITFYSIFDQFTVGVLMGKGRANGLGIFLRGMTLVNILIVSISIVYILISTITNNYFKNIGFDLLLLSWITNSVNVIIFIFNLPVRRLSKKGKNRDIGKLLMFFISLALLIYLLLAIMKV